MARRYEKHIYTEKKPVTKLGKRDGWNFTSFGITPGVVVAEKTTGWRDDDRLWDLKKRMRCDGHLFSWDDEIEKTRKKKTRVQVYIKVGKDLNLSQKVDLASKIIDSYDID